MVYVTSNDSRMVVSYTKAINLFNYLSHGQAAYLVEAEMEGDFAHHYK